MEDIVARHPGYLGLTSRDVIAIHADWPAYPSEHGWQEALRSVGLFPHGTTLRLLDEIDQCLLFVYPPRTKIKDPYDPAQLHVAIWAEDAMELHRLGLATGRSNTTLAEWIKRRRQEWEPMLVTLEDGGVEIAPRPIPADFGDDEEALSLMIRDQGIQLTKDGWGELDRQLSSASDSLHPAIKLRAVPIAKLGQFDSAVREACVLLETRLRSVVGGSEYGQHLADKFVTELQKTDRFVAAYVKLARIELRTAFKFVRNEYMHNVQELTATQCYAILARLSALLCTVDEWAVALGRESTSNTSMTGPLTNRCT